VYAFTNKITKQERAVKRTRKDHPEYDAEEICKEARLMRSLAVSLKVNGKTMLSPHKGIVGAYDLYECEESSDFVLEKVGGGELFDVILERHMEGTMKEREASSWIRQVLEAIAHCHSKGIVHLDMKPENCLLMDPKSPTSALKLADFGLATVIDSGLDLKEPTGTMEYAAPEVIDLRPGAAMQSKGYSYSADVWSVGVMAYIILVGISRTRSRAPCRTSSSPSSRRTTPSTKGSPARRKSS